MRLTGTSYAVLSVLDALGPATPYDLKQALEISVENFWPVPHTTFYAEPERLAVAGLLSSSQEPAGRRRKVYALTDEGRDTLQAVGRIRRAVAAAAARGRRAEDLRGRRPAADHAGAPGLAHARSSRSCRAISRRSARIPPKRACARACSSGSATSA